MLLRRAARLALLSLLLGAGGCITDLVKGLIHVEARDAEPGMADAPPFDGAIPDHLLINAVKPDHGPFVGGTEVVIYGFGFTAQTSVRVGGRAPDAASFRVLSPVALQLTTPAGEVGAAEVEVNNGKELAQLPGGFTYDPVALDPASGPSAGGTLVSLLGKSTNFVAGLTLTLGGKPFTEVEVVSSTLIKARTPAGTQGPAELLWSDASGEHHAPSAFTYYASSSPKSGGMGGGPLQGSLTVAVLNWQDRKPVPGALVLVQRARLYSAQAKTDTSGIALFSSPDLKGPVTVSAALSGYEATTIAAFDARDLTIFLLPVAKPQPGPTGPGTVLGAVVKGNLIYGGATGGGSPSWQLVPEPKPGQMKRTYVFLTSPYFDWGPQQPQDTATIDWANDGTTAWPFILSAYPGNQAVYAIAGLYTKASGQFDPYAMGVTRGVAVGPGETQQVDVWVNIPLTEKITVEIEEAPPELNSHQLRLAISLGADGFIMRQDQVIKGDGPVSKQVFARLPSFTHHQLIDATYTVDVQLQSGDATGLPNARAIERSVRPKGNLISVGGLVGVPQQVKPAPGSPFLGNTLVWSQDGAAASLAVITLATSDATPLWRVISRGDLTAAKLPDPASLGLSAWPSGVLVWTQWLAHIPGFSFDTFTYSNLSSSTWDRWATDAFDLQVP